ncbi:hypothetical protein Pelo_8549 [Pelomyxa schiedti]|nr:hypothetical protein Pelo_8549 [Pelomyxa schiedti]
MERLLALVAVLLVVGICTGQSSYLCHVETIGNDWAGCGSELSPCLTIRQCMLLCGESINVTIDIGVGRYPPEDSGAAGSDYCVDVSDYTTVNQQPSSAFSLIGKGESSTVIDCGGAPGLFVGGFYAISLTALTIANGTNRLESTRGGCLTLMNSNSTHINNMSFTGCYSAYNGGALFVSAVQDLVGRYCDFSNNQAEVGDMAASGKILRSSVAQSIFRAVGRGNFIILSCLSTMLKAKVEPSLLRGVPTLSFPRPASEITRAMGMEVQFTSLIQSEFHQMILLFTGTMPVMMGVPFGQRAGTALLRGIPTSMTTLQDGMGVQSIMRPLRETSSTK